MEYFVFHKDDESLAFTGDFKGFIKYLSGLLEEYLEFGGASDVVMFVDWLLDTYLVMQGGKLKAAYLNASLAQEDDIVSKLNGAAETERKDRAEFNRLVEKYGW